ncbi:hypothetical protein B0675_40000 [Streptomyces sp. M41(2017)]|uniref:hypothetical protein n=1 Tax=Streptomyces sp. M41(2017) TaxID=1955065 RepID=UPI0009C15E8F|nr:hypothetical protein [Streptomyces sp. M41(2017)]OQQ13003.1 hypothetical protein B0675_40000 [Streptomyces sp. M41(2017)]
MATQIVQNRAGAQRPTSPLPPAAVQAMHRIEHALAAPQRELAAKVGKALGFRGSYQPREDLGETATRHIVWSQVELNAIFERVGGTVTARHVERSTSDGSSTWMAIELILTVNVQGVGPVQVTTDLEEESAVYPTDLPVVRAAMAGAAAPEAVRKAVARYKTNAARYDELSAKPAASLSAAEFYAISNAQQNLAENAGILADAGVLFLVKAV